MLLHPLKVLSTIHQPLYYCMHNNKPSFRNLLLNLQNVYSNDLASQNLGGYEGFGSKTVGIRKIRSKGG